MSLHTDFVISQTDGRPMYAQVIDQVRHKVAVGDWPAGAEIPSIRQLAAELSVSVITIKRAYQELERDGVIHTQQGRGSFVSQSGSVSTAVWERQLDDALAQVARAGRLLGLSRDQLRHKLDAHIQQEKED